MKLFKKAISLCLALMMVVTLVPMTVVQTEAATGLPDSIYLTQAGSSTCTLCSAAMMLRARMYLSGSGDWSAITESGIRSTAWKEGSGLWYSFTYKLNGNSMSVSHASVSGISISSLKSLLDSHPEGIVLYCGNLPHAVFLTDYEGDTFYCADTISGYSGKRISLDSSYLGKKYGSQAGVLNNVTAYWYVSDYSIDATSNLPSVIIPEGEYVFHCVRAPEKVLDIQYDSKEKGANVQLYENLYNTVQKFRVVNMGDYYCIQSVHSGMWLDIAYPYNEDNCNIQLWDTNTSQEQKWVFQDAGDGNVYIKSLYGMYLDTGGATDNGTNIRTWHFDGSTSQQWKLIRTSDGDRVNVDEGIYTIHSVRNPSKVLDIAGNSLEEKANIQLYDDLNDTVQQFRIIKENNYYLIQSVWSGHWLDIAAPFNESGANVQLFSMNTNTEEKWVFEDAGNGNVYIRSLYETYVDTKDGATDNHTNVQMYTFDGTTSMQWTLHKVYDVTYDANESVSLPDKQFKQENISLTLRNDILKDPVGYTITYNGNEGLVQIVSKKVSRVFAGWRCDKDGKLYAPGASFDGNFNTEMTAEWSNPQVGTLPLATRKGYSFEGWFTSETGGVRVTEETILQKDTELYAQWKKLPVVGLDLVSQPHKTVYVKGEQFDETGIALRAHYEDGSDELLLDGFEVEGFSSDSIGNKIVSVKKDGCVQQFVVRVTVLGDLNVDERITISDVADLLDVLSGKKVAQVTLADANSDGSLTIADVATILDSIAGKDIV